MREGNRKAGREEKEGEETEDGRRGKPKGGVRGEEGREKKRGRGERRRRKRCRKNRGRRKRSLMKMSDVETGGEGHENGRRR